MKQKAKVVKYFSYILFAADILNIKWDLQKEVIYLIHDKFR